MDGGFKCYHLSIVNLLEEAEELEAEQATTDDIDNKVTNLFDLLLCLTTQEQHEVKVRRSIAAYAKEDAACGTEHTKGCIYRLEWC